METVAPLYVGKSGCVYWDPRYVLDRHLTAFVYHGVKEEGLALCDVRCVYLVKQGEAVCNFRLENFFQEVTTLAELLIDASCFVGDVNVLWSDNSNPVVYVGDYERGAIHDLLCSAKKNPKFTLKLKESRNLLRNPNSKSSPDDALHASV